MAEIPAFTPDLTDALATLCKHHEMAGTVVSEFTHNTAAPWVFVVSGPAREKFHELFELFWEKTPNERRFSLLSTDATSARPEQRKDGRGSEQ